MKRYLLLVMLAAKAFAGADEDYVNDVKDFAAQIRDCDKLIISPNPLTDLLDVQCGLTIDGVSAVRKIATGIHVSEKLLCRDIVQDRGREVVLRDSCQCYGEGDLLFFKGGRLRLKARVFHWTTLDVETAEGRRFVLDLAGRSKELEGMWDFFFPQPNGKKG